MEIKVGFNVMDVIEKVYKHSQDSHLREPLYEVLKEELKLLSGYLQINEFQSLIFANCFILGFEESSLSKVFRHFGLEEYKLIKYKKEIDLLFEKKFLKENSGYRGEHNNFEISRPIINAVSLNIRFHATDFKKKMFTDILEEFDAYSDRFDDDIISKSEMIHRINELLEEHRNMPFVKQILNWKLDSFETFFFLDTLWDAVKVGDNDFNTNVQSTVEDFYKRKALALSAQRNLIDDKTKLTKLKLIEFSKDQYKNRVKAKLSKNVIKLLKEKEDIILDFFASEQQGIVYAGKIPEKPLFYNEGEKSQLDAVAQMLMKNKFVSIQKRLKEKAMPVGFTILLYGLPGTGKTESVYQLARRSGRNIMKVDISETKSMWFGESQKLAKKIFTDYKEFKETEKNCPILLLNEADGIIGKRKAAGSSNVADTENAIQNIFLEELENFDGILFATTNLVANMDTAFERRFLYKVQFQKPATENSKQIWKSKLTFLNESECKTLAEQFGFSGGEMENIARKALTNEILTGEKPDYDYIEQLCQNEKWATSEKGRIGF